MNNAIKRECEESRQRKHDDEEDESRLIEVEIEKDYDRAYDEWDERNDLDTSTQAAD